PRGQDVDVDEEGCESLERPHQLHLAPLSPFHIILSQIAEKMRNDRLLPCPWLDSLRKADIASVDDDESPELQLLIRLPMPSFPPHQLQFPRIEPAIRLDNFESREFRYLLPFQPRPVSLPVRRWLLQRTIVASIHAESSMSGRRTPEL